MPLYNKKPVVPVPLPAAVQAGTQSPDTPVFLIQQTGEIFLDYEEYAQRIAFYHTKVFACETSGKADLDYFAALESEKKESEIIKNKLPEPLKKRILKSVQFQFANRLDGLVDLIWERYFQRYFPGERLFVDLQGEKYYCQINKVFPPAITREYLQNFHAPQTNGDANHVILDSDAFSEMAHLFTLNFDNSYDSAKANDPAQEYLYTVQLMDNEGKFEGSFMEVMPKQLGRDRVSFSKSILKRFLKECTFRESSSATPWQVKADIAKEYNLPLEMPEHVRTKVDEIKAGKRKKPMKEEEFLVNGDLPAKRRKRNTLKSSLMDIDLMSDEDEDGERKKNASPDKKGAKSKYPMEDLELDPTSIFDARVYRRGSDLPKLPVKPIPHSDLPVPQEIFEQVLTIWNMINIFGVQFYMSPFTLDDFASALKHNEHDTPCRLLAEVHGNLINCIAAENTRISGFMSTAVGAVLPQLAADWPTAEDDGMTHDERAKWCLVGMDYTRGWDKLPRLKASENRARWEYFLIGVCCHRGGLQIIEGLPRILKQLFFDIGENHPGLKVAEVDENNPDGPKTIKGRTRGRKKKVDIEAAEKAAAEAAALAAEKAAEEGEDEEGDGEADDINLTERYCQLSLLDRMALLNFVCDLALSSKGIRNYVDHCELLLTEHRKDKLDINRERKQILADLNTLEANGTLEKPKEGKEGTPTIPAIKLAKAAASNRNTPSKASSPASSIQRGTSPGDVSIVSENDGMPMADPDVPSDVDELASSGGEEEEQMDIDLLATDEPISTSLTASSRRQPIKERQLEREMDEVTRMRNLVAQRAEHRKKLQAGKRTKEQQKKSLEDDLAFIEKRDDLVEREMRRHREVGRARPLGKDRFCNRYWWFDGIGAQPLVGAGNRVQYGTGVLLIQGPSQDEYNMICDENGGEKAIAAKRKTEEGEKAIVGVDQWAYYNTEEEIDGLFNWLNVKGIRESGLKTALTKWRKYLLDGARNRLIRIGVIEDDQPPLPEPVLSAKDRKARAKKPDENQANYLQWSNSLAR